VIKVKIFRIVYDISRRGFLSYLPSKDRRAWRKQVWICRTARFNELSFLCKLECSQIRYSYFLWDLSYAFSVNDKKKKWHFIDENNYQQVIIRNTHFWFIYITVDVKKNFYWMIIFLRPFVGSSENIALWFGTLFDLFGLSLPLHRLRLRSMPENTYADIFKTTARMLLLFFLWQKETNTFRPMI
jgi:hypothetical protein